MTSSDGADSRAFAEAARGVSRFAPRPSRNALAFAGACALAPIACLLGFLAYQGYSVLTPESTIAMVIVSATVALVALVAHGLGGWARVLLMATLVTLALDYLVQWQAHGIQGRVAIPASFALALMLAWAARQRLAPIFGTAFAAVALSTVLVPAWQPATPLQGNAPVSPPADSQLPVFVHLVLDGHIGTAGLPAEVAGATELGEAIVSDLVEHGFRVYERAFSRHPTTRASVSAILNLEDPPHPNRHVRAGQSGRIVATRNDLYAALVERGYRVEVIQPDGYDWCSARGAPVERCDVYPYQMLRWLDSARLSPWEASRVIVAAFLNGSTVWFNVTEAYVVDLRAAAPWLPRLPETVFTYVGIDALERLASLPVRIERLSRGNALFAHILLPHGPHVFDADCGMRADLDDWREPERQGANAALERWRSEYRRYFGQVRCVHHHLDRIMTTIAAQARLRDAVIVLHGDHGSRIPRPIQTGVGARSHLVDGLSTLFAVRAPGIVPGRDGKQEGLDRLFATNVLPALGLTPSRTPDGRAIFYSSGTESVRAPDAMPDI